MKISKNFIAVTHIISDNSHSKEIIEIANMSYVFAIEFFENTIRRFDAIRYRIDRNMCSNNLANHRLNLRDEYIL